MGVVACSTILFELVQTRILSYIFWNHIVYLTISLALLGFGISGTITAWISRSGRLGPERFGGWVGFFLGLMGVSLLLQMVLLASVVAILPTVWPTLKLAICYLITLPPFICAGCCLAFLLMSAGPQVSRLYSVDLICASAGCVLFFFLLPMLGAVMLLLVLSVLLIALGIWWLREARGVWIVFGAVALFLIVVQWMHPDAIDFYPEDYKEMSELLYSERNAPGKIERTAWTSLCRVDVVGSPSGGDLLDFKGLHAPGSYKFITQDGSANTRLLSAEAIAELRRHAERHQHASPATFPYEIYSKPDVAIIGTGGGVDVANALAYDARSIFCAELNPEIYRITGELYSEWNGGLMRDSRVTAVNAEGRNAIRTTPKRFDLIQVISIDTFAALNAGAYVLSENYLYTVEAFEDYFAKLKTGGMLSIYRWSATLPRESLRLSALAIEAWRRQGVSKFSDRIMVIGDFCWSISLFKENPFTEQEVSTLARFAQQTGETVLFWPQLLAPAKQEKRERDYYHGLSKKPELDYYDRFLERSAAGALIENAYSFRDAILSMERGEAKEFYARYPHKVSPVQDDYPFFFETASLSDWREWDWNDLRGSGVQATLLQILVVSTLVMAAAILLPLWIYQRQGLRVPAAGAGAVYFAALGLGFMVIEICLMQKCILLLGNPMLSVPVVLAGILLSAGIGSRTSEKGRIGFVSKIGIACAGLVAALACILLGLGVWTPAILEMTLGARIAVVALMMLPVGFALGIFFPAGLQWLQQREPAFVPWAWGINGCASVYGSVLAIIGAMAWGFQWMLAVGLVVYGIAVIAGWRLAHKE